MKINRLEVIQNIEKLESRKVAFEKVLNDLKSHYCNGGKISFELDSTDFNKKYNGEEIVFDEIHLKEYLEKEIEILDVRIDMAISDLTK